MRLCCIFNYAPLYRESIYKKIDDEFDTKFYFAEELEHGKPCNIKKLDYKIFKKKVGRIENRKFIKWGWKSGIQLLPYKNYDAFLITADAVLSFIPFLIACKILRKPVYAWGHGNKSWSWKSFGTDRLFVKLITGYFTYGEGGCKKMIDLGVPKKKLHVIYNSLCEKVDVSERVQLKSDVFLKHFGNNLPTLIFIGRLTKVKQLDWIIRAMSKHQMEGVFYNVLIIGDGPKMSELRELSHQLHVENNLWLYGECYDNNVVNTLLYNADLCVSPGNVGLTALHSMMYGTPVLSNDNDNTQMPEYETIVSGKTGDLYKYNDFDDFCVKIVNWLNANHNRDLIRGYCYAMINDKWNSNNQMNIFRTIIKDK